MLLERIGVRVDVIPPSAENFKVTLPRDRDLADLILRARRAPADAARLAVLS